MPFVIPPASILPVQILPGHGTIDQPAPTFGMDSVTLLANWQHVPPLDIPAIQIGNIHRGDLGPITLNITNFIAVVNQINDIDILNTMLFGLNPIPGVKINGVEYVVAFTDMNRYLGIGSGGPPHG